MIVMYSTDDVMEVMADEIGRQVYVKSGGRHIILNKRQPYDEENKPVGTRRNRPDWVFDDIEVLRHAGIDEVIRRYRIIVLYWRKNWSAKKIAEHFKVGVEMVKSLIHRSTIQKKSISA